MNKKANWQSFLSEKKTSNLLLTIMMRVFMLLLCFGLTSAYANNSYSQTKLDVDLKNGSLEDLFEQIHSQSEFIFFYNDNIIKKGQKVSINLKQSTVDQILNRAFLKTDLAYKIIDRQIVITKSRKQVVTKTIAKVEKPLQNIVTGVVTTDGLPLPGASILVKGTSRGAQTDFNGKYELEIAQGEILIFSYVGFTPQEIAYAGQASIDVVLVEDANALGEVVVTGYSKQSTKDITGSVTVVKSEDLVATSPTNFEQALQGQASGVIVSSQGAPGEAASVRIRGFGTINGNDPLYIIDGTPTGAGLVSLNPNDIESIQVLKDASSAAIYGNRAANGVVIVTTKGGRKNARVKFSGNAYMGVDFIPNSVFPDLASPQQILDASIRASQNDGTAFSNLQFGNGSNASLPVYLFPQGAQTADESSYDYETNRITRANAAGTDWFNEYFNSAIVRDYNISASGGSENASFFMSLNALDQEGVGQDSGFERYTIRANSNFSVTDRFRLGENVSVSYSDQVVPPGSDVDNGTISNLYRLHPIIPVRDVGGNYAGVGVGGLGNAENALATAANNRENNIVTLRALGNAYLEYDILSNLTFKTNLGFDIRSENRTTFTPWRLEGETVILSNNLEERSALRRVYTWFNTLNYNKDFGKHSFDILGGTEFNKSNFREFRANRGGFLFNDANNIRYLNLGTDDFTGSGFGDISSYYSVFGKVDYKFDDKYLITGTLRYDSSSVFNSDYRDGIFPSFSVGWRVSNEAFLQDSSVFTNLMIKAGYGVVANNGNIDSNRRVNVFSPNADFYSYPNSNTGSDTGYGLDSRGNSELTWETTTTLNVGFTSRLFDLVNLDFDYYDSTTDDMLLDVPQDPTVYGNVNTITKNLGEMSNKGFDISLSYSKTTENELTYNFGFNISGYKNEVVSLDENPNTFITGENLRNQRPNRTQAGQPLASFYGKRLLGIDENGRFEFANDGEQEFIGNPHPDFTYGINLGAAYKNFDFSALIQGSQGNDIYNFTKYFTDFNTFIGAKSIDYVNSAGLPALTNDAGIIALESEQSSYYIEDGSYVRLKNIAIGYSLPDNLISRLSVDKVRFYIQGKNLITLTEYSGLDPEVNFRNTPDKNANLTIGVDSGVYPITRSVNFGLNVSF